MGRRRAGDLDVDVKGEGHRLHHHDEEGQAYGQCGEETVVDYRESKLPAVPNQGVALILPEPPFAFQTLCRPQRARASLPQPATVIENRVKIPAQNLDHSKGDLGVIAQKADEIVPRNKTDLAGGRRFRCHFVGFA